MILKKMIYALGVGILAPQLAHAQPEAVVPLCGPAVLDCAALTFSLKVLDISCKKNEESASSPQALSGTAGTGIDQPCKGFTKLEKTM